MKRQGSRQAPELRYRPRPLPGIAGRGRRGRAARTAPRPSPGCAAPGRGAGPRRLVASPPPRANGRQGRPRGAGQQAHLKVCDASPSSQLLRGRRVSPVWPWRCRQESLDLLKTSLDLGLKILAVISTVGRRASWSVIFPLE